MPLRLPWVAVLVGTAALALSLAARPARAEDPAAKLAKLNKQALDAFDNLNFEQAKALLEQALEEAQSGGLTNDVAAARTHLHLGMVLIAGFQRREPAILQFEAALKIQPDLTPLPGLFNPEVQVVWDEVRAKRKAATTPPPATAPAAGKPAVPDKKQPAVAQTGPAAQATQAASTPTGQEGQPGKTEASPEEGQGEEEEEEARPELQIPRYFVSLGLGSGFGTAKGHLDANKDIFQGSRVDNSWPGGLAPSGLGHLALAAGYFVTADVMVSLEGRLQIVSGTTSVTNTPSCMPSCSAPSTGIAGLAKASWFLAPSPIRPFVTGGVGGGSIRQVVKVNVVPTVTDPDTHCGSGGKEACVDTVTGGPLFLVAGGGLFYEMGSLAFIGSLTANVGVPNFMLNVDALLGVGLRL